MLKKPGKDGDEGGTGEDVFKGDPLFYAIGALGVVAMMSAPTTVDKCRKTI